MRLDESAQRRATVSGDRCAGEGARGHGEAGTKSPALGRACSGGYGGQACSLSDGHKKARSVAGFGML